MKSRIKLNLGNIAGAAINAIPELQDKIDTSKISDMNIEVETEYSLGEAKGLWDLIKQISVELPNVLFNTYKEVVIADEQAQKFDKMFKTPNTTEDESFFDRLAEIRFVTKAK